MNLANRITISRILLIPVFVGFSVAYGRSVAEGQPHEWQRAAAIATFLLASLTDGIDGWVARRWNQGTRLGAILDPIADKGLLITAIITLSLSGWTYAFPLWFPALVIARDLTILAGCAVLHRVDRNLEIRPTWSGKSATVAQMLALTWMMLQLPHPLISISIAGVLTLWSGLEYIGRGLWKLRQHSEAH